MVQKLLAAALLVTGCVTFPGAFVLQQYFWVRTRLGLKLKNSYGLSNKDCADISVKVVSAFQAVLASISGAVICSNCYENVLYSSHPMTLVYAWFGIPYFIYDTLAMFYVSRMTEKKADGSIIIQLVKFIIRSPVIVIHHMILAPLGFSLIVLSRDGVRNGDFFVGIVYLMELSTPGVSLRYILSKFKMKSSPLYILNGIFMLVMFPIFRIASPFYTVQLYAEQNGLRYFATLLNMPLGWKFIFFAAIAPQIYWYFLMWNGLIKMIRNSGAQNKVEKVPLPPSIESDNESCGDTKVSKNNLERSKED